MGTKFGVLEPARNLLDKMPQRGALLLFGGLVGGVTYV